MTTSRVRIYVLARNLEVPPAVLLKFVQGHYPAVANTVSTLSETQAADVAKRWEHSFTAAAGPSPTEPQAPLRTDHTSDNVAVVLDSSGQMDVPASLEAAGLPAAFVKSGKSSGKSKKHDKKGKKAKRQARKEKQKGKKKERREEKKARQVKKEKKKKARKDARRAGKKAAKKAAKNSDFGEVVETSRAMRKNGSRKNRSKKH